MKKRVDLSICLCQIKGGILITARTEKMRASPPVQLLRRLLWCRIHTCFRSRAAKGDADGLDAVVDSNDAEGVKLSA